MRDELSKLEERWGMAVQSAGFGIWDLDIRRQTVHYPPEWKAMLGYGEADGPDSTAIWRDRVHPDDLLPMLDAQRSHFEGRQPAYEMEFRLQAADGSVRWVLSRGKVVERGPDGQAWRAVGTLTDLTDRRAADGLRVERDRAEAASRAKSEFLARMSHELRTPLNAVLGFAQLLARAPAGADPDEQRRYARHIEDAGWHLLKMVNDVLDLQSLENEARAIELRPVALAPLLQSACGAVAARAAQRGLAVHCSIPPAGALVLTDPARLLQVLDNLLRNAVQYNRAGGTVCLGAELAEGVWVLSVTDTGLGIPAAQLPHLFEPFNRLGRDSPGPTGVGLLLVHSLLSRMGGQISVRSALGAGSTFELRLPAAAGSSVG